MHKIIYIDDDIAEINIFERNVRYRFEVEAITISKDIILDDLVTRLIDSQFEYLIIDFHLNDKANCGYNGDDVLKHFLEKLPHFPVMLLTNYDMDAIETAKKLDADKIYSKPSKEDEKDLLFSRIKTKIEQYAKRKEEANRRLLELRNKKLNSEELTANEEEEALELDTFLEQTLDPKAPYLAKSTWSTNSPRIEKLLQKTDSLIKILENYEEI